MKARAAQVVPFPEHLTTYDLAGPCAHCGLPHDGDRDEVLARYHAMIAVRDYCLEHDVDRTTLGLPCPPRRRND
ncbi:MAG: hypothetical protein JWL79_2929 [Frankiales bacterium]|nr:hypothetical protein [Frankiales bacterium]